MWKGTTAEREDFDQPDRKMFPVVVFLVALLGLLSTALGSGYMVTSDDSGKNLAAIEFPSSNSLNGFVVSSDYGKTWNSSSVSYQQKWWSLASDSSGIRLALFAPTDSSGHNHFPLNSKDEGVTWTEGSGHGTTPVGYMVASDGSGNKLIMSSMNDIYASDDGGSTWSAEGVPDFDYGSAVAYSADGSTIVYHSNNRISKHKAGGDWASYGSPEASWNSLSTSSKGTVTAGCYNVGYYANANDDRGVYITKDWVTFTPLVVTSGPTTFNAVSVTDDGSLVYYGGSGGVYVYNVSSNATVHSDLVASTSVAVWSIATSKTGKYAVVGTGANIWTSSNYGKNFKIVK